MNVANPEVRGTLPPLMNMFKRWDETRPPDNETIILSLAEDIRSNCRNIHSKIREPWQENDLFTIRGSIIDFNIRETDSLIPRAQKKPTDWSIEMSLKPYSFCDSSVRMFRFTTVDGKTIQERKSFLFKISDDSSGPITWHLHDLKLVDMQTQDYRDLLKITSVLLGSFPSTEITSNQTS